MAIDPGLVEIMVFIGAVMGALAATMIPYWQKLRETPELIFERKFIGTAVLSAIAAFALAVGTFPTLLENIASEASTLSLGAIFAITAAMSFGINRGANMALSAVEVVVAPAPAQVKSPTT